MKRPNIKTAQRSPTNANNTVIKEIWVEDVLWIWNGLSWPCPILRLEVLWPRSSVDTSSGTSRRLDGTVFNMNIWIQIQIQIQKQIQIQIQMQMRIQIQVDIQIQIQSKYGYIYRKMEIELAMLMMTSAKQGLGCEWCGQGNYPSTPGPVVPSQ